MSKPRVNSESEKELARADEQFQAFNENVKAMATQDKSNLPVVQEEPQTKLSTREIRKSTDYYLKPKKTLFAPGQKFNTAFTEQWNYLKEYVRFIVENKEASGEWLYDVGTRRFGGLPYEVWDIPVNKPVWGPRHLAEQLRAKVYDRFVMEVDESRKDAQHVTFCNKTAYIDKKPRITCEPCPETITVGGFTSAFK